MVDWVIAAGLLVRSFVGYKTSRILSAFCHQMISQRADLGQKLDRNQAQMEKIGADIKYLRKVIADDI